MYRGPDSLFHHHEYLYFKEFNEGQERLYHTHAIPIFEQLINIWWSLNMF